MLKGRFAPEQGAVIQQALEKSMEEQFEERADEHPEVAAETPRGGVPEHLRPQPVATRRADALERLAETFLAGASGNASGGDRYLINVHIEADVLPADGGETALDNLVLLCRRHHRLVHEGGFGVHRGAGNEIWFSYPGGDTLPATADGRFSGNARQVRSLSEEKGLDITARSLWTEWTGTPIDYNYAQGLLEQYDPDER